MFTIILSALLFVSPLVSAHGTLARVSIDGTVYAGPPTAQAGASPASIIRQVADVGPVKGATNPDMACGLGSTKPASLVAPAKPGSKVTFQWMDGAIPWIHEVGPMMTYMAECTGTTCDKFDASKAQWFKIDQVGQRPDGTWFQAAIKQGNSLTIDLPKSLASGDYLIRHEIIALHNAASLGGAEFYPACTQVRISAPSSPSFKALSPSNLVGFPGGYSDTDSSLVVPDIYNPGFKYTMPGPKLSNVAAAAGQDLITASLPAGGAGSSAQATGSSVEGASSASSSAAATASASATQTASATAAVKTVTVTVSATACATATSSDDSDSDGSYKRMVKTRRAGIHGSHGSYTKRSKTSMWAEAAKKAENDEVKRAVAEGEHMRVMSRVMRSLRA